MDKFTGLLVVEVGLPTSMNIFCFLCLVFRCIKIANAGLLYNTAIPTRITMKRFILAVWFVLTFAQLILLNLRQAETRHYHWMQ